MSGQENEQDREYWEQLEEKFGFAPGELEQRADAYESGTWPDGTDGQVRVGNPLVGRPRLGDGPTSVLSVRVLTSDLEQFDLKAKENGQSRTERLRDLIKQDIVSVQ